MKKEEFDEIISKENNFDDLPNAELIKNMDLLSDDFEFTKNEIIKLTYYLDKVEELYNKALKVYNTRTK